MVRLEVICLDRVDTQHTSENLGPGGLGFTVATGGQRNYWFLQGTPVKVEEPLGEVCSHNRSVNIILNIFL